MKPNSILIFDGTKILHKATGISDNEERIVLAFTFCDICTISSHKRLYRKLKELILNY